MDSLFDDLQWRGLVYQVTDEERARTALRRDGGLRAYIGFDPTASSLHVGSLLPITMLMRLQRWGHMPIALVGGGTGLIGDPSGKSQERVLQEPEVADAQAQALARQLASFLDRDGAPWLLCDNKEWLQGLNLLEFLRVIGKRFSVNAMVARDSVKARLNSSDDGMSFTEFSYMLLQGYDFLELYRRQHCRAQFGGSDQWGNIVSGLDLIDKEERPSVEHKAFGLTMPLVTTKAGQKFGKTESGAVWLDAKLTSPYQFFQFWMNADDDDACKWLRYFTLLEREEIERIEVEHRVAPETRLAQRTLARDVTRLVHGPAAVVAAMAITRVLFEGGDVRELSEPQLEMIGGGVNFSVEPFPLEGLTVADILVGTGEGHAYRVAKKAKEELQKSSVQLNGLRLGPDFRAGIGRSDLLHGRFALVKIGKRNWCMVEYT